MKNIDVVKKFLEKRHPGMADEIKRGDSAFICNRFLPDGKSRKEMAESLRLGKSKCCLCSSVQKEELCVHFSFPLNNCRNGILAWLEEEK